MGCVSALKCGVISRDLRTDSDVAPSLSSAQARGHRGRTIFPNAPKNRSQHSDGSPYPGSGRVVHRLPVLLRAVPLRVRCVTAINSATVSLEARIVTFVRAGINICWT